jgi:hypothetical protein
MTTRDVQEIVLQMYEVVVSATLVSAITEDLDAEATAWPTRPFLSQRPIVYFDGIAVPVRGRTPGGSQHTAYYQPARRQDCRDGEPLASRWEIEIGRRVRILAINLCTETH